MFVVKFLVKHWGKIVLLLLAFYLFGPIDQIEETLGITSSRMHAATVYGRLAPFPKDTKNFTVTSRQGMFSLLYSGSFSAKPEIIADWLKQSPGVREGLMKILPDHSTQYTLEAKGSFEGKIIVSSDHTHVSFDVVSAMDTSPHKTAPSTNSE